MKMRTAYRVLCYVDLIENPDVKCVDLHNKWFQLTYTDSMLTKGDYFCHERRVYEVMWALKYSPETRRPTENTDGSPMLHGFLFVRYVEESELPFRDPELSL